jgi:hypothetical protein
VPEIIAAAAQAMKRAGCIDMKGRRLNWRCYEGLADPAGGTDEHFLVRAC